MASKTRSMKASEWKLMAKKEAKNAAIVETEERIPHITEYEDLVDILPDLAQRHRELTDQEAAIKKEKSEISAELDALLGVYDLRTVRGDSWAVVKVAGAWQEKIVPELLLKEGVSVEQIAAATEKKQNAGYIQVRKLKSEND